MRDALGAALPVGVPEAFTEPVADPLGDLLLRYARTHGPFPAARVRGAVRARGGRRRRGARPAGRAPARLVRGELRPGRGDGDTRVLRRRGAAAAAAGVAGPVAGRGRAGRAAGAGPVPAGLAGRAGRAEAAGGAGCGGTGRRGRAGRGRAARRGAAAGERAGVADPARPAARLHPRAARRADRGRRGHLDRLRPAGRQRRLAGARPGRRGRPAAARAGARPRRDPAAPRAARRARASPIPTRARAVAPCSSGELADRGRPRADRRRGAGAGRRRRGRRDLGPGVGRAAHQRHARPAAGPARRRRRPAAARAHRTRRPAPRGRYAQLRAGRPAMPSRTGPPSVGGRWALVADRGSPTRPGGRTPGAEAFLERHGVLTRGALGTERVSGGFAGVYRVLRAMEDSGRCRRGYIVEGLGAAQFAVPGAIDRLRAMSRPDGTRDSGLGRTGPAARATTVRRVRGGARTSSAATSRSASVPRQRGAAGPAACPGWCSPPPTRPSPTAPRCPGRTDRRRHQAPAGAQGRCAGGAGRRCAGALRGARRAVAAVVHHRARRARAAAARRWPAPCTRGGSGRWPSNAPTASDSLGSELAEVLTEAGFRVTPKGLRLRA